jgi:acetyltransferase
VLAPGVRKAGHFVRAEAGLLAWSEDPNAQGRVVGRASDLASAISALRDTDRDTPQVESSVEGADSRAVLDVLFGPRRALSDPASKAALVPYGIPVPLEELCSSPSRAAAEANRIGYPVRISLTSPDLRIWDHPDLAVDMVDNAARVRDTFRQLMGQAKVRLPLVTSDARASERLLGVMVTATSEAAALLGVRAWPLPRARVGVEVGFADPHGYAASDRTLTVLPSPLSAIERALRRLLGSELLFGGSAAQRKARLDAIGDVLLRISAFVHDRRSEIETVELRPVALLLDGSVEVREACVAVSDAFERSLSMPPGAKTA